MLIDIYIVHWSNAEESDEMGAECFFDYNEALSFLTNMIEKNYPKDHLSGLPEYDDIELNEVVDPEALFPYNYMISSKILKF